MTDREIADHCFLLDLYALKDLFYFILVLNTLYGVQYIHKIVFKVYLVELKGIVHQKTNMLNAELNALLEESGRMNLPSEPRNHALSSRECYFFFSPTELFYFTGSGQSQGTSSGRE